MKKEIEFNSQDKAELGTMYGKAYRRFKVAYRLILSLTALCIIASISITGYYDLTSYAETTRAVCNEKCEQQKIDNQIPEDYNYWTDYCNVYECK